MTSLCLSRDVPRGSRVSAAISCNITCHINAYQKSISKCLFVFSDFHMQEDKEWKFVIFVDNDRTNRKRNSNFVEALWMKCTNFKYMYIHIGLCLWVSSHFNIQWHATTACLQVTHGFSMPLYHDGSLGSKIISVTDSGTNPRHWRLFCSTTVCVWWRRWCHKTFIYATVPHYVILMSRSVKM